MMLDALREVSELNLTTMKRKHSLMALNPSSPRMPREVGMAKKLYFLFNMVELSSETSHDAISCANIRRAVLYRFPIDPDDE